MRFLNDKIFKTESHTRLSFNRRGLLGMASPGLNCNGSQFFFTLGEALELNGKHTLFGRVVGNTLFNMLRLADVDVVNGDQPTRLHRIVKSTVVLNPYDDIVPRQVKIKKNKENDELVQPTAKATKYVSLFSYLIAVLETFPCFHSERKPRKKKKLLPKLRRLVTFINEILQAVDSSVNGIPYFEMSILVEFLCLLVSIGAAKPVNLEG